MENRKAKIGITIASLVLSAGILFAALVTSQQKRSATNQLPVISATELSSADGKGSHACYVAVDKTVYQIPVSPLWVNGQHTTSEGRAYCGADMSRVIDKAPHGRSKLATLKKIGTLQ